MVLIKLPLLKITSRGRGVIYVIEVKEVVVGMTWDARLLLSKSTNMANILWRKRTFIIIID